MIGSVTQYQEQVLRAEVAKCGAAIPQANSEQIRWTEQVGAEGDQASAPDRMAAALIRQHEGLDVVNPDSQPDSAPPGTRALADALRQEENNGNDDGGAEADGVKNYGDRGAVLGPGEPLAPRRALQPAEYGRPYIGSGHGAESPMARAPMQNPMPALPVGVPTPVALPGAAVAAAVPNHVSAAFCLGSPSER